MKTIILFTLGLLLNGCVVYIIKVEPQKYDTIYIPSRPILPYREFNPFWNYQLGDTLTNFVPDTIWKDCK